MKIIIYVNIEKCMNKLIIKFLLVMNCRNIQKVNNIISDPSNANKNQIHCLNAW